MFSVWRVHRRKRTRSDPRLLTAVSWLVRRVADNEGVNKMSSYNLATVFGPTLLRPSEKDGRLGSSQPLCMNDSWSLEVMSQVEWCLHYRTGSQILNGHVCSPLELSRYLSPCLSRICRYNFYCISSNLRTFRHQTANDKAFSSHLRYSGNVELSMKWHQLLLNWKRVNASWKTRHLGFSHQGAATAHLKQALWLKPWKVNEHMLCTLM